MWGLKLAQTKLGGGSSSTSLVLPVKKKNKKPILPRNLLLTRWKATELFFSSLSLFFSPPPPLAVQTTNGPGPPHCPGFTITPRHTHTHSAGFLWTTDQSVAETSTWQHTTFTIDIHAPVDIWTRTPASEQQQTHALARPLRLASQILYHYVTPNNHNNRTSFTASRGDIALNSLLSDAVIC